MKKFLFMIGLLLFAFGSLQAQISAYYDTVLTADTSVDTLTLPATSVYVLITKDDSGDTLYIGFDRNPSNDVSTFPLYGTETFGVNISIRSIRLLTNTGNVNVRVFATLRND